MNLPKPIPFQNPRPTNNRCYKCQGTHFLLRPMQLPDQTWTTAATFCNCRNKTNEPIPKQHENPIPYYINTPNAQIHHSQKLLDLILLKAKGLKNHKNVPINQAIENQNLNDRKQYQKSPTTPQNHQNDPWDS